MSEFNRLGLKRMKKKLGPPNKRKENEHSATTSVCLVTSPFAIDFISTSNPLPWPERYSKTTPQEKEKKQQEGSAL